MRDVACLLAALGDDRDGRDQDSARSSARARAESAPALRGLCRSPAACNRDSRFRPSGILSAPTRAFRLVGVNLVKVPHRALLRIARIGAAHARRIRRHRAELLRRRRPGSSRSVDRVAVGLPTSSGRRDPASSAIGVSSACGSARIDAPAAFEVAEEALAIAERQVRLPARPPAPRCLRAPSASPCSMNLRRSCR